MVFCNGDGGEVSGDTVGNQLLGIQKTKIDEIFAVLSVMKLEIPVLGKPTESSQHSVTKFVTDPS